MAEASDMPGKDDPDYYWRDFVDKKTGRTFFVNLHTDEKTWRKPDLFIEEMLPPPGLPPRQSTYEKALPWVQFDNGHSWQNETGGGDKPPLQYYSAGDNQNVWLTETSNTTWTVPVMHNGDMASRRSIAMARSQEMISELASAAEEDPFLPMTTNYGKEVNYQAFLAESESEEDSDFSDDGPPMEAPPPNDDVPSHPPPPMDMPPVNDSEEEGDSDFSNEGGVAGTTTTQSGLTPPGTYPTSKVMASNVVEDIDDSDEEIDITKGVGSRLQHENYWFDWSAENWQEWPWIDYAKHHFRPEVKGWISKRSHEDDVKWAKKLSNSLMDLEEEDVASSKKIFLNITKYCKDRKGKKEPYRYIEQTLASMLGASQSLQDETYTLLVKQTNGNPCEIHPESKLRAWRFLAICCGIFPPSQTQVRYLVAYLRRGMETEDPITKPWCEYALKRLDSTMRCGRRKYIPLKEEILCAEDMKPVHQTLYLLDGTTFEIDIESQDRVDETLKRISETLSLNRPEFYGLFEMQRVEPGHIQGMFDKLQSESKDGYLAKDSKIRALRSVPQEKFLEESDRILMSFLDGLTASQSYTLKKTCKLFCAPGWS